MKYAIFSMAFFAAVYAAFVIGRSRKFMGYAMMFLFASAAFYESVRINFWPNPYYRGTCRGMEISFLQLTAFAIVLGYAVSGRFRNPFRDFGFVIYLLYFLWSALAFKNAANYMVAWWELWKMIMMMLVFCAAYEWLANTGDTEKVMMALVVPVVWNFFEVVKQHYFGNGKVWGVFNHKNTMAMFMTAIAPIYYAYFLSAKKSRKWYVFVGTFVLAAGAALRTYSRGAMVCMPVGLGLTTLLCIFRNFRTRMLSRIVPVAVVGVIGIMLLLPKIVSRFLQTTEDDPSGVTRIELALSARNMMADKPWLGVGLNNWGIKINRPYPYNVREWVQNPTNEYGEEYKDGIVETIYLLVGAECGLPGLFLLILWFAYYTFSALRLCKRLSGTSHFYIAAGAFGGFTCIFVQSILEWVLKQALMFAELMTLFALVGYLNAHWRKIRKAELGPRRKPVGDSPERNALTEVVGLPNRLVVEVKR